MLEVILRIRPGRNWLIDFASKFNAIIKVHDCTPFGEGGAQGLIEIDAKADDADKMIKELHSRADVLRVHLTHSKDRKIIISVVAKKWVTCLTILKSDCYLRDANVLPDGMEEWRLFTPGVETLEEIMTNLKEVGCKAELLVKRRAESADKLTKRELFVVQKALEFGYFDFPRRITSNELARRMNVTPPTLSELLRRAGKKTAEYYIRKGQI
jgi:predicted DNA binding protein